MYETNEKLLGKHVSFKTITNNLTRIISLHFNCSETFYTILYFYNDNKQTHENYYSHFNLLAKFLIDFITLKCMHAVHTLLAIYANLLAC